MKEVLSSHEAAVFETFMAAVITRTDTVAAKKIVKAAAHSLRINFKFRPGMSVSIGTVMVVEPAPIGPGVAARPLASLPMGMVMDVEIVPSVTVISTASV